jgi:hypothetical protein
MPYLKPGQSHVTCTVDGRCVSVDLAVVQRIAPDSRGRAVLYAKDGVPARSFLTMNAIINILNKSGWPRGLVLETAGDF